MWYIQYDTRHLFFVHISALTDLIMDDGDKVVITDTSWPATPGEEEGQAVKIELITDKPFELTQ